MAAAARPPEGFGQMTQDEQEVLAANQAFYAAFASRDAAAMESL